MTKFVLLGAHNTVLDYADLFSNTTLQEFDTRWEEILLSMTKIPSDDILESLYKFRIRESEQLKIVLELYHMEIHQKISMPNYQRLNTMVKRSIDQKLRMRKFDARHEKIETGAVVKSHRGLSGVERGKGICHQWKEKVPFSKGNQCSFRIESNDHAQKPKAEPPSEPQSSRTQGRSVSRKRSVGGRSQSGNFNRPPCEYFLQGTCTKSLGEYWHPPECQFCITESGRKIGAECSFPHWKVEEQPNKGRKRVMTKSAVAIVKKVHDI